MLDQKSLAKTLDNLSEAWFYGKKINQKDAKEIADWISERQGVAGCYAKMFAPTEFDLTHHVKLFTGDELTTGASKSHILGEESIRALVKLGVKTPQINKALELAKAGMEGRLQNVETEQEGFAGFYCCGSCTAGYWRNLSVGGLSHSEERLEVGVGLLKNLRSGTGRWFRFPFYYTVLALSEIDLPAAKTELQYAAPSLERMLKKKPTEDKYNQRKRDLAERVLTKLQ
ncbi:MAG TPA: hypothetical protein PKV16_07215 [Caldisericia bacterium]|nr:hypothetical protein [Caldisericia bacterium]HPF49558.1 hypothetical protein [Caldisericia bacterium]HPI84148.1 hypothetical protein [Caldisericia bacterium]HPQ93557.1 hypothetical protein [Caldisericia bacterium]HRV75437.1 hypothetical protein [Caldisericia bacterium]